MNFLLEWCSRTRVEFSSCLQRSPFTRLGLYSPSDLACTGALRPLLAACQCVVTLIEPAPTALDWITRALVLRSLITSPVLAETDPTSATTNTAHNFSTAVNMMPINGGRMKRKMKLSSRPLGYSRYLKWGYCRGSRLRYQLEK